VINHRRHYSRGFFPQGGKQRQRGGEREGAVGGVSASARQAEIAEKETGRRRGRKCASSRFVRSDELPMRNFSSAPGPAFRLGAAETSPRRKRERSSVQRHTRGPRTHARASAHTTSRSLRAPLCSPGQFRAPIRFGGRSGSLSIAPAFRNGVNRFAF